MTDKPKYRQFRVISTEGECKTFEIKVPSEEELEAIMRPREPEEKPEVRLRPRDEETEKYDATATSSFAFLRQGVRQFFAGKPRLVVISIFVACLVISAAIFGPTILTEMQKTLETKTRLSEETRKTEELELKKKTIESEIEHQKLEKERQLAEENRKAEEARLTQEQLKAKAAAAEEEKKKIEEERKKEEKQEAEERAQEEKRQTEEKARLEVEKKQKEEDLKKYYDLGRKAYVNELYQEAAVNYTKVLEINPDNIDALIGRSAAFFNLKKYTEAMQDCDRVLIQNPDNIVALGNRCLILSDTEKYVEALECYDKLLARYRKCGNRSCYQDEIKDIEENKKQIKKKIAKKEAEEKKREETAKKAAEKERQRLEAEQKKIEKEKRKAEEKEHKRIEAEQKRIEEEKQEAEEARKRAEKLTREAEKSKQQTKIWSSQGYDFYRAGNYNEAIKCFDQALAWNPKYVYALYNRGLALHKLNRCEEALVNFDQAIAVNSNCQAATGSGNDCFNQEEIANARKATVETKKRLEDERIKAEEQKRRTAKIILTRTEWSYGGNFFTFQLAEENGIGAVFNRAELRIWKLQYYNESPQSFKQRQPLFWEIADISIMVKPSQTNCELCVKGTWGGKNCRPNHCAVSLQKYREWLQEMEWIEVTLRGTDDNGHPASFILDGYDRQ